MIARAQGVEPLSIDREPTTIGVANRAANRARGGVAVALLVAIFGSIVPPSATATTLKFAFTPVGALATLQTSNPTLYGNVTEGFTTAGNIWAGYFRDDMTLNVNIDYPSMGYNILGSTNIQTLGYYYADVRAALQLDRTSADDFLAASNLPAGPYLSFLTNDWETGVLVVDANDTANNAVLDVPRANAKALGFTYEGIIDPNDATLDASISFSSDFDWDFDRSDGISSGTFDFVGVAIHEIGHAMGFLSGVDYVDFYSAPYGYYPLDLDPYRVFTVLDLYRHGARNGGGLDFAADGTGSDNPYFSLDGGATALGTFSTGSYNGDGRQASHWKDNLGLGILDPTFDFGELGIVSALDVRAFDAIGYDLVVEQGAVPEIDPAGFGSALALALGVLGMIERRRQQASV
ncbi:MAG: hypothetical protein RLZZ326_2165 [Planctomycetota bacterium]|jgi:hypothetical protein